MIISGEASECDINRTACYTHTHTHTHTHTKHRVGNFLFGAEVCDAALIIAR